MAAFNDATELIKVTQIQEGNARLSKAISELYVDVETSIWYNDYIKDKSLMIQVPVVYFHLKNGKGQKLIVYFSDWHEYDGYNGRNNAKGKYRISYVEEGCDFDEYEIEDYASVEKVVNKINEK